MLPSNYRHNTTVAPMEANTLAAKAQKEAVKRYIENKIDEIKVRVPKGRKEIIQAHAESKK